MGKVKYVNVALRLKRSETVQLQGLPQPMEFKSGDEFHIVGDVVYMKGFPLPPAMQPILFNWIDSNIHKFVNDTRQF